MKKSICILLAFVLVLSLTACGGGKASEWTREGTFKDENGNFRPMFSVNLEVIDIKQI